MSAPTLYKITGDWLALGDLLAESETGTIADAAVVAEWLKELGGSLESKIDGCVQFLRIEESIGKAALEESQRLRARAAVHEARVERIKEAMKIALEAAGEKKIETPHGAVWTQANGGKRRIELDRPIDELPKEIVKMVPTLDEEAARAALEAADGNETSWGRLAPRGTHLRVK